MNDPSSPGRRLRDWLLVVVSSTALSLAVLTFVIRAGAGNLLDQLLREKGMPSSLAVAIGLLAVVVACGAVYVVVGRARAQGTQGGRDERAGGQIGS